MKKVNQSILAVCAVMLFAGCEKHSPEEVATLQKSKPSVESISPEAASVLLKENSAVKVLDIRTPKEFAEGHIDGAINIDFLGDDFDAGIGKLDKSAAYIMHCASGGRSGRSLPQFEALGFEKIYHLDTGFGGWKAAGLPVNQ